METVYVGLGGNIGDATATITQAAMAIKSLAAVTHFKISRYYLTTPVSPIPQAHYVNAVCCFQTSLELTVLFAELERISALLGKVPKMKEAPRIIDLDLLFFGRQFFDDGNLRVPHARWKERLFVLLPLLDLTTEIVEPALKGNALVNLKEYVQQFPNVHNEIIVVLKENFYRGVNEPASCSG